MDYYTATQVAQRLDKTEKTIRKWIKSGKLPATEVQNERNIRQWQIAQSDLDALLEQSADTSNTSTGTPGIDTSVLSALVARVEQLEQSADTSTGIKKELDHLKVFVEGEMLFHINELRTAKIDLLDHVEALDARVTQLETYLHRMTAQPPVDVPTAVQAVPARAVEREAHALGMPVGEAAALVGLSRRHLADILDKHDTEQQYHTAIKTNRTDGQMNRYMTDLQIEAFRIWRKK